MTCTPRIYNSWIITVNSCGVMTSNYLNRDYIIEMITDIIIPRTVEIEVWWEM